MSRYFTSTGGSGYVNLTSRSYGSSYELWKLQQERRVREMSYGVLLNSTTTNSLSNAIFIEEPKINKKLLLLK